MTRLMQLSTNAAKAESGETLRESVLRAIEENKLRLEDSTKARRYLDPSFHFVRLLKAIPAFSELSADEAADLVERLAPSVWSDLPSTTSVGDLADSVSCFLDAWESVKVADGALTPLRRQIEAAWEAARALPPEPGRYGPRFARTTQQRCRDFLALIEEMQLANGSGTVPIPQDVMADVLDVAQQQVSRWIRLALRAGLMVREVAADRRRKRCAEYRFVALSQIRKSGSPKSRANPRLSESATQVSQVQRFRGTSEG